MKFTRTQMQFIKSKFPDLDLKQFAKEASQYLICPICITDITDKFTMDCCNNDFCKECIKLWYCANKTCPLCRDRCNPKTMKYFGIKVYSRENVILSRMELDILLEAMFP